MRWNVHLGGCSVSSLAPGLAHERASDGGGGLSSNHHPVSFILGVVLVSTLPLVVDSHGRYSALLVSSIARRLPSLPSWVASCFDDLG